MSTLISLVIHLERATARRAHVQELLTTLPYPAEILPAVDAATAEPTEMARYDPHLGRTPHYPFKLSKTEVAVTLSHRRAWQRIIDSGAMAGLIVEDDVVLDPELAPTACKLAETHLTPATYIRLPDKDRERPGETLGTEGPATLIRPRETGLGMQAQIVGRDAAARLLKATARFDRPVDTTIQMAWETGVTPLAILPPVVRDISAGMGGSTLTKRSKTLASRLRAEFLRARYRAAISRRARR